MASSVPTLQLPHTPEQDSTLPPLPPKSDRAVSPRSPGRFKSLVQKNFIHSPDAKTTSSTTLTVPKARPDAAPSSPTTRHAVRKSVSERDLSFMVSPGSTSPTLSPSTGSIKKLPSAGNLKGLASGKPLASKGSGCDDLPDGAKTARATLGRSDSREDIDLRIARRRMHRKNSFFVQETSAVFAWGMGQEGQLGSGKAETARAPVLLDLPLLLMSAKITQVACGGSHTLMLSAEADVFAFGSNRFGQLGLDDRVARPVPTMIGTFRTERESSHDSVKQVECGDEHSACVMHSGSLWTMGAGDSGRLGHGDVNDRIHPVWIQSLQGKSVKMASCGAKHTAALTDEGRVLTWGSGEDGRLGHGTTTNHLAPKVVEDLDDKSIIQVHCGSFHSLALGAAGNVYTWGSGFYGKLGHGNEEPKNRPKQIAALSGVCVLKIAGGMAHTVALGASGEVYTCGWGKDGRLGHGDAVTRKIPTPMKAFQGMHIQSIACGRHHTAVTTEAGEVFTWGANDEGQLGMGDLAERTVPSLVPGLAPDRVYFVACGVQHTVCTAGKIDTSDQYSGIAPRVTQRGSSLASDLARMMQDRDLCDLAFIIDQREIMAHKIIVFTRSEGLRDLAMRTEAPVVHIDGCSYDTFMHVLQYIYTDDTNVPENFDEAIELMGVAQRYGVHRLVEKLTIALKVQLTSSNALSALMRAARYNVKSFYNLCKHLVLLDYEAFTTSKEYQSLPPSVKDDIVKSKENNFISDHNSVPIVELT